MRRDMRASLALAFPEKDEAERDAIARASLVHLGWVGGELITMRSWAPRMDDYVEAPAEAIAIVEARGGAGQGDYPGARAHRELGAHRPPLPLRPAERRDRQAELARQPRRARRGRPRRNRVGTLWRDDPSTGRAMLRLFKQAGTLGILIDQDIRGVQSVFVPFFGRLATTPRAAADFALRCGAAVLVVTCHRRGPRPGDGHRLEVVEVPYDRAPVEREAEVVRLTAACVAVQEQAIRRNPAEWVWMHQRWKSSPPAA